MDRSVSYRFETSPSDSKRMRAQIESGGKA